jgi:hypothetical protein
MSEARGFHTFKHFEDQEAYFLGGRNGMGLFLTRALRGDAFWGVSGADCEYGFLGWIRETFSLIRLICECTA